MFRPDNRPPQASGGELLVVFQAGELITDPRAAEACLLDAAIARLYGWREARRQFVGYWGERPCYALEIDAADDIDFSSFQRGRLHHLLGRVDESLFALAGRAQQLLAWEAEHRFCGRCGSAMRPDAAERAMCCEQCGTQNFPRIAPCTIVLVTRGEEMLLARNASFPGPFYSTLAGFIEAGESVEETLVREVREEVGIEVGRLQYYRSQSWPFPNQLMLGFFAEYVAGDIVCDMQEIIEADWFHYRQLPQIPPASTIAGQLIRHHVKQLS